MKRVAVVTVLLTLLSLGAFAQQQPPTFGEKLDVNVVLLDTIVTDAGGHQILGLDKNDFLVKENGVEQTVDAVDYFTNRQLLTAQEKNAPFKVEQVHEKRYFIFFFDKPAAGQLWQYISIARNSARDFINKQMRPGDEVAIVGHDVRLKIFSDFTTDKKQLLAALDDAGKFSKGITEKSGTKGQSILASVSMAEMMNRSGTVYEGLEVFGNALRPIPGRKNLILFSAGIYEPGQEVRDGILIDKSRYYDAMIESLNSANVSVYGLNLLRNDAPTDPIFHQTMEQMAADTNGTYYRYAVSFTPILKKIEQANNGYYLISYTAHHARGTHGYQKVSVSILNHPEFKVQAREGYTYGETQF